MTTDNELSYNDFKIQKLIKKIVKLYVFACFFVSIT